MTHRDFEWQLKDLDDIPKNGRKVFSTFACGGGSSMGYKLAGFDVVGANDIDPQMAWHYRENLKPRHYFECPVRDLVEADLPDELFGIDILDGSPPCSSFSYSGIRWEGIWGKEKHFREGQSKQVLDDLFFHFLEVVDRLRPKIVVAENVKGMVVGDAKGYSRAVMRGLRDMGYDVQLFLINAADFGVPQWRERVFFLAIRREYGAPPITMEPTVNRHHTVREAIDGLVSVIDDKKKSVPPSCLEAWHNTVPGAFYDDYFYRVSGKKKFFTHGKLNPAAPSWTVQGMWTRLAHWAEPRRLTLDEVMRISTWPTDYTFKSVHLGGYLMGMAVPPWMMRAVASNIVEQWLPYLPEEK